MSQKGFTPRRGIVALLAVGASLGAGAGASAIAGALESEETPVVCPDAGATPPFPTADPAVQVPTAAEEETVISGCPVEDEHVDDAKGESEKRNPDGKGKEHKDSGDEVDRSDESGERPSADGAQETLVQEGAAQVPAGDADAPAPSEAPPAVQDPPADEDGMQADPVIAPQDPSVETPAGEPAPLPAADDIAEAVAAPAPPPAQVTPPEPELAEPLVDPSVRVARTEAQPTSTTGALRAPRKRQDPTPEHLDVEPGELPEPPSMIPPPDFVTIDPSSFGPLELPALDRDAISVPFPSWLLPVYHAAAVQYQVPWPVLAAINEVETDFGNNAGVSSAGAVGWMQFLPSTWAMYGTDGNGDGEMDPAHPVDAIFSAARYLRAAGAKKDLAKAIWAYNHADWYVRKVLARAGAIGSIGDEALASLTQHGIDHTRRRLVAKRAKITSVGRAMLLSDRRLARFVLADERITIYECGRRDIQHGIVDRRVLLALVHLAQAKLEPVVSSLRCGHGYYTKSGNVSHHTTGTAVDVAAVGGKSVLGHQGEGSVTDRAIRRVLRLQGALVPHQVISLMRYEGHEETLAMADHHDHIHLGFAPLRPLGDFADEEHHEDEHR